MAQGSDLLWQSTLVLGFRICILGLQFFVCFPQCSIFRKIGWREIHCLVVQDPHVFHWLIAVAREFKKKPAQNVSKLNLKINPFFSRDVCSFFVCGVYYPVFKKPKYLFHGEAGKSPNKKLELSHDQKMIVFVMMPLGFTRDWYYVPNCCLPIKSSLSQGWNVSWSNKQRPRQDVDWLDFIKLGLSQAVLFESTIILYGYSFWLVSSAT